MSVKIALAGNPNCGKTTLFNALTGSNQFVGNWPGVTVEKKEGKLKGHKDVTIMDLPGIYSLSPYTLEEVVARNYLINERPDAIINIVDGTNIERNLYLSTQIMELGIPVVMAVNMMDLVEKAGDKIHTDKLSKLLGCEVVEISALKGTGIQKAAEKAISLAERKKEVTAVHEFDSKVEDAITTVGTMLGMDIPEAQKRFFAIKLLEKDDKIKEQMKQVPDISNEIKALEDAGVTSGKIGIVNVNAATDSTVKREAGFRKAFEGTDFELMETQYGEGDAAKSQTIAENYITQGVVGIFGCNEGSTTGTGNAIKASGSTGIIGVGFDKSDAIMNLINDGYLLCTMAQNPDVMGKEGVKAAVRALEGEELGGAVSDTGVSVLKKN